MYDDHIAGGHRIASTLTGARRSPPVRMPIWSVPTAPRSVSVTGLSSLTCVLNGGIVLIVSLAAGGPGASRRGMSISAKEDQPVLRFVDDPALPPPHGYRHAAVIAERAVYTSGQTALNADGEIEGGDDLTAQTSKAIANVLVALRSGGSGPGQIVQLELFVVGLNDVSSADVFRGMGRAARDLGIPAVATTILGVEALSIPGALVEVRALGLVPDAA